MPLKANAYEILKNIRERRGFIQSDVSNALGKKSGSWLGNIEGGKRELKARDLGELADFYGVEPSVFFDTPHSRSGISLTIDKYLRQHNTTVKELADKLDLDYFRIAKGVTGEIDFSPEELQKIGNFLKINESPFIDPIQHRLQKILLESKNLGLTERKIEMLKTFLEDEILN